MKPSFWMNALLAAGLSAACSPARRSVENPAMGVTTTDGASRPSTTAAAPRDSADLAELVAHGREVYRGQYCGLCHRLDAVNAAGAFGPPHNGMGSTADNRVHDPTYSGSATTAEEYIRESIIDPSVYLVPGYGGSRFRMPAYTHLSEADIDALVQMLLEEK